MYNRQTQRQLIADQRFEAFEAWQREHTPVQLAREVLDPSGFMYRRAAQLVAEQRRTANSEIATFDPMSDLLGGARMVVASEEAGYDSAELRANHRRDIRTLFTEALLNGGHISEVESRVNAQGEAELGGLRHWELFLRAANIGNEQARIAEIAEEFYSARLFHHSIKNTHALLVVSPSRPDIKGDTLMVRSIWFEKQGQEWERKTQQLYVKQTHLGDINQLLRELGVQASDHSELDAIEILNQPLLIRRDQFGESVAGFARMLDVITAERIGQPVFCGLLMPNEVDEKHYAKLLENSRRREHDIDVYISDLEQASLQVVRSRALSFEEENQRFATKFIQSLQQICIDHPEYAEAAFGSQAAGHYQAAFVARQRGDTKAAQHEINAARALSTAVDACETSISLAAAKAEVSPYASLQEKYGFNKLQKGMCFACRKGDAHQVLGPCGFCNDCDRQDRLRPGYIEDLIKQQTSQPAAATQSLGSSEATTQFTAKAQQRIRSGYQFKVGEQVLELRYEIQIGDTRPLFITEEGEEISGKQAKILHRELQANYMDYSA